MSGLNLIPNPAIVLAEAGVFFANLIIAKRLIVNPYLKLKDARNSLTFGAENQAQTYTHEKQKAKVELEEARKTVRKELEAIRESVRKEAIQKREDILAKAHDNARQEISSASNELRTALAREQAKLEKESSQLAQEICTKLLG